MRLEVYGNKKKLTGPFQHRGIDINIYAMEKGAAHCKKQHDFRTRKCGVCGDAVLPRNVFMAFVDNRQASLDCDSQDEAFRIAKLYVEANFDDDANEQDSGDMVGFDMAGSRDATSSLALETIAQLGWASHAIKLLREDAEAARNAAAAKKPPAKNT